jgi:DNA polymerase-3 subunit gamma/tau
MTYYLKYRSKTLDELDLENVRESLKKIVASGNISHALLFSGPKGIGKTSAARILAKIINCEGTHPPCNKCDQCVSIAKGTNIDVIELDAASNRGIDDIRALRDAVKLSPARGKKKIYIIDEAHMLTTEAGNALLKTLEEPPSHVVFILATTNPEKLLPTIRSRAVNILFQRARPEEIERSLTRVVRGENIKIDKESLRLIAEKSGGSFRDAHKTLEQLISEGKKLDPQSVRDFLFNAKAFAVEELIANLLHRKTKEALEIIEKAFDKGAPMENLANELLTNFRISLLGKVGEGEDKLPDFTKEDLIVLIELMSRAERELKDTTIEQLPLEMAVIEWCEERGKEPLPPNSSSPKRGSDQAQTRDDKVSGATPGPAVKEEVGGVKEISQEVWKKILAGVKPINSVVEALLRAAKPMNFDGKTLTLGVFYRFHKERLETTQHRKILEDVIGPLVGVPVRIVCKLTEPPKREAQESPPEDKTVLTEGGDKDIIKAAEEIFGN